MSKFNKFIEYSDLFGYDLAISLNNQTRFKSPLGSLFTLTTFFVLSFIFYFGISDIVNHKSIYVTKYDYFDNNQSMNLTQTFPFALTILDNNNKQFQIPETLINFQASLIYESTTVTNQGIRTYNKSVIQLGIGRCQEIIDFNDEFYPNNGNIITQNFKNFAIDQNIGGYFCLKQSQNLNIIASPGYSEFQHILIKASICNGTNSSIQCDSSITNKLQNAKFHLLSPNYAFKMTNIESPGNLFPVSTILNLDFNKNSRKSLYYQNVDYFTDNGYFTDTIKQNYFKLAFVNDETILNSNSNNLLEISIINYPSRLIYIRYFYSFSTLVSIFGSSLQIMILIFHQLINRLMGYSFQNSFFENLFPYIKISYSHIYDDKNKILDKTNDVMKLKENNEFDIKNLSLRNDLGYKIFFNYNYNTQLYFFQNWSCCVNGPTKKFKFKLSQIFFKYYLNWDRLIDLVNEFEGFKKLTFDPEQKFLFETYNKVNLNYDLNYQANEMTRDLKDNAFKLKLIESIKRINLKTYKSNFDLFLSDYFLRCNPIHTE